MRPLTASSAPWCSGKQQYWAKPRCSGDGFCFRRAVDGASLVAQLVKNLPATWIPSSNPGSGKSLGEGIGYPVQYSWTSLVAESIKNPPALGFDLWVGKIPWRRAWPPTPVFLPGESPWREKPGGLQPVESQRVRHHWATKHSTAIECQGLLLPSHPFLFHQPLGHRPPCTPR